MDMRERLIEIIKERSYQYSSEPKFKLASGAVSNFYFNMKKTTQTPEGMHLVGKIVFEKIRELKLHPDAIGGLTLGADPIAYAVAMYSYGAGEPIEAFVIRKEPRRPRCHYRRRGNDGRVYHKSDQCRQRNGSDHRCRHCSCRPL
jgi:orotate phosphoribosyltransferase